MLNYLDHIPTILAASTAMGSLIFAYTKWKTEITDKKAQVNSERLSVLENQLATIELLSSIPSPSPMWIKNSKREYVYSSPSHEHDLLFKLNLSSKGILYKKDEEVFPQYPELVSLFKRLEDTAQDSPRNIAVARGITLPRITEKKVVIKEIAQDVRGETYYLGRYYTDFLFNEQEAG